MGTVAPSRIWAGPASANQLGWSKAMLRMRHGTTDLDRRLVLAEPLVDNPTEHIVLGPSQILDLAVEFGLHPMDPAQDQRAPNRLVRGGVTSSGISHVASGCKRRHRRQAAAVDMLLPSTRATLPQP